MRSFKHFLNENTSKHEVYFVINFSCSSKKSWFTGELSDSAIIEFFKTNGQEICEVIGDNDRSPIKDLHVKIKLAARSYSEQELKNLIKEFFEIAYKFIEDNPDFKTIGENAITNVDTLLLVRGIDGHSIFEYPKMTFTLNINTSLVGFHKLFKFEHCVFYHLNNVIKGGLGILKSNAKPESIKLMKSGRNDSGWVEIIINHLGDRDLLACQDELIENGFHNFAIL